MSNSKNRKPSKTLALRRAMSVIPAPLKSNLPLALIAGTALAGVETAPLVASHMGLLSPPSISAPATTASPPLPPAPKFDLATRTPATQEILPPRPVADLPTSGVAEPLTPAKPLAVAAPSVASPAAAPTASPQVPPLQGAAAITPPLHQPTASAVAPPVTPHTAAQTATKAHATHVAHKAAAAAYPSHVADLPSHQTYVQDAPVLRAPIYYAPQMPIPIPFLGGRGFFGGHFGGFRHFR
jgi:hypothetical protein